MNPLPMPDPLGLPASASLINFIFEACCTLNIVFLNIFLGIIMVIAAHHLFDRKNPFLTYLSKSMRRYLPAAAMIFLSTIFLPLLALFVLYGHLMTTTGLLYKNAGISILLELIKSAAFAALIIAFLGYIEKIGERATKYGMRLLIVFTVLGSIVGIFYLSSSLGLWNRAIPVFVLALFLIGGAILGIIRPRNYTWGVVCTVLMILIQYMMIRVGTLSRAILASPYYNIQDLTLRPQPLMTAIFFIALAAAIAAIVYISHLSLKH